MSIEETNSIDVVAYSEQSPDVKLVITDHLDWRTDVGRHLLLLQEKINAYLRFVEGGEFDAKFPHLKGLPIVIQVVGNYRLSEVAEAFFARATTILKASGYRLEFELHADTG